MNKETIVRIINEKIKNYDNAFCDDVVNDLIHIRDLVEEL